MKKLKKLGIIISLLVFILVLLVNQKVFANNTANSSQKVEYSENFQKWLELSDEEKKNVIQPRMYVVPYTKVEYKNPLLKARMLGSSLSLRYSLKDIITDNISIRDQQNTGSCWAFASLSSLETNLALKDYYNGKVENIYDFSERHMEYATSRIFSDGINSMGYNRTVGSGGNWDLASSYLTNGLGAIDESEMQFENNEDSIEISKIQNKTVTSQVYDTVEFPDYNYFLIDETEANEIKNQIKNHIQNNGAVMGSIVAGGSNFLFGSKISDTTGAVRVSNGSFADHAISIIGWDDEYSVSNWDEFEENYRPKSDGAWIGRNSWGSEFADNGLIYISYEDQTVSQSLNGIIKATNNVEYDNIYQYDYYYPNSQSVSRKKMMFCNIFDKKNTGAEYLTQVSLHIPDTYTCKVYVNPNGTGKSKNDLQLVTLKAGESKTFNAGYHTLEFAKPIEITADKFAVAIELSSVSDDSVVLNYIRKDSNLYSPVEVQAGKCFKLDTYEYVYEDDWSGWEDLSEENAISTIKAFTTNELLDESLKNIEMTNPPTKTSYFEGESFDKTGMVVKANYNSRTNPSVILDSTSYNITNGTNLQVGQTSVTITYQDKSVNQTISVEKNSITELKITTPPEKTEYKEGQNFDSTGMVIEATYKDGTTKTITDYTIQDGNNLKSNQTKVTISYEDKLVEQPIIVTPNPLIEIKVTKAPNKTTYIVGQNFDKTGMVVTGTYEDETTQEILDYTIENGTNLNVEQTSVTIKYKEKTTTQPITVEEKAVTGISVDKKPTKLTYIQNKEDLDLTGGSLKITYNDGTTENIAIISDEVTAAGFSNTNVGKITITITYQSKTTQFEIEILEEEKAVNSNLDNAKSDVKKVQAYYFTDNAQKNYTLINVEINDITRNTTNDTIEYYYYLSTNTNEQNINNWTKITEKQNSSNKLQFTIDTRNISNYNEIASEEVAYLYIKEVAIKGGNQSIAISKSMKLETNTNIETYVDNVKKDNLQSNSGTSNSGDNTLAPGKLPQTGVTSVAIVSVISAIALGILFYKKYNKFKDIK